MAIVDLAAITNVVAKLFAARVQTQLNRAIVLGQVLDARPEAGQNIQWVARSGTEVPTTAVIADGDDVTVFNNDTREPAVLQYGTYHDGFKVSGKALNAAAASGNPMQLANLFAEELTYSVERLAVSIAVDIYDGDGGTDTIAGLFDATNPAIGDIGTYAGLNRSSRDYWKGNVVDAEGSPLTFDLIRQLKREIYVASGTQPDIFFCDATQHDKLGALYKEQRRYLDTVTRNDGSIIKLDGGYNVLEFDGTMVLKDKRCPDGTFGALNSSYVSLAQLANSPKQLEQGAGMLMLAGTPEYQKGEGRMRLSAQILPLAQTGRAIKTALFTDPQLVVKRPNSCGYLTNLAA
jgi:hypothetical protein